jgi:hypothetical protein
MLQLKNLPNSQQESQQEYMYLYLAQREILPLQQSIRVTNCMFPEDFRITLSRIETLSKGSNSPFKSIVKVI